MKLVLTFVLLLISVLNVQAAVPPANVVRVIVDGPRDSKAFGTGTLIRDNLIITNYHVVRDMAGRVRVVFPNWSVYEAKIVKTDKRWDLAALRIQIVLIPPMQLGNRPSIGDIVSVGGYGSGWYETDSGKVVKFYQPDVKSPSDLLMVDATVRNGDSGGPIIKDGKLVGVLFGCAGETYGISIDRVLKFLDSFQ